MKAALLLTLFLIVSCSDSSGNKSDKRKKNLNILAIGFSDSHLTSIEEWSNHMPNYTISTHNPNDGLELSDLDTSDVVLLFTNNLHNTNAVGDTLFKYVMDGGHLLLGTFYSQQKGDDEFGELNSISPTFHDKNAYIADTLIVTNSHPITIGIDTLIAYYGAGSDSITNGAERLINWESGEILAAQTEPNGRVLEISVFPAETNYNTVLKSTSDKNLEHFFRLWSNAIRYIHSQNHFDDDFLYDPNTNTDNEGGGDQVNRSLILGRK